MKAPLFFFVLLATTTIDSAFASPPRAQAKLALSKQSIKEAKQIDPFLLENNRLRSKNPAGLIFTLQLTDEQKQFQQGEVIRLELSFSSTIARKFILNDANSDHSGRVEIDNFILDHEAGTSDPLYDFFNSGVFGFLGGGGSGMPELTRKPELLTAELNEWIRFDRPGHYRLYVVSKRVGKTRNADNQSGTHRSDVVSNVVEFDIVPAEKKWATQKLYEAVAALDKQDAECRSACRTLRFLGTEAAVSEIVKRFSGRDPNCDFEYDFGLIGSPHRELVIRTMERALTSSEHPVTDSFVRTLALLAFTREPVAILTDPNGDNGEPNHWQEQLEERRRAYQHLVMAYLRQLVPAVPYKQEEARATTLKTILDYQTSFMANDLAQLQSLLSMMPGVFSRLPIDEQIHLLTYQWKPMASESMLKVLREVYNQKADNSKDTFQQRELRSIALRRLYELSPEEGRHLILDEIRRSNPSVSQAVLRLLPDETLPELDDLLASNLEASRKENGDGDIEAISALIERYASAEILRRVQAVYEAPGVGRWACRIQSSLLAYFLRVDPTTGRELLNKAVAARSEGFSGCYATALTDVAQLQMTAEVEEAAKAALQENDPELVSQAANMLGRSGSSGAEMKLWQRLERWHDEMRNRANQLSKQNPGLPAFGNSALSGEALIEQALRNALSHGQAWFSDVEKLKRLRALCLTDSGRNEIDGLIQGWNQRIDIGLGPFEDDPYSIRVAHYQLNSLESLEQKLKQFPRGTVFTWARSNGEFNEVRGEELFRQIEIYLKQLGMKLERENKQ